MSKRHKHQPSPHQRLKRARILASQGKFEEANELLEALLRQDATNVEALLLLREIYTEIDDQAGLWYASARLVNLKTSDPAMWRDAFTSSVANMLPFSALYYLEHFLTTWPDHEAAPSLRESLLITRETCDEIRRNFRPSLDATLQDLKGFEEVQMLLMLGHYGEARQLAEQMVDRLPHITVPWNDISLAYAFEGQLDQAIEVAEQVLVRFPDNVSALSNLTQFLVRAGRREEAQNVSERLLVLSPVDGSECFKQIEALTYLGDDAAVTELYERLEAAGFPSNAPLVMIYHLAAVAFARLGNLRRAKQLWKSALKLDRDFSPARENLEDLREPIGKRSGAWPFILEQWVGKKLVETVLLAVCESRGERDTKRAIRRVLDQNPSLVAVLPVLLERGDSVGREFALRIAMLAELPVLQDFVVSLYGTDESRLEVAQYLVEVGMLPRGQLVPIYLKGEPRDIRLTSYEITGKAQPSGCSRRVEELYLQSYEALQRGDSHEALRLIETALDRDPDKPTLLNIKMVALDRLGREEEARALLHYTAELHPDYLFARCGMAQLCAREGKVDEAHEWLDPLLERPRFHIAEFRALSQALIFTFLADGDIEAAKTWQAMWSQADEDAPSLRELRRRFQQLKSG